MAVQKNFVVKHGLEVNDDLIYADNYENRVGIGTTDASEKLHVSGNVYVSDTVLSTDLNLTGVGSITTLNSTNATISNLNSSGQSVFINGPILAGSATSTGTSNQRLQVTGDVYVSNNISIGATNSNDIYPGASLYVQGEYYSPSYVTAVAFYGDLVGSNVDIDGNGDFSGTLSSGIVLVGSSTSTGTPDQKLQVTGNSYVSGNLGIGTTNPTSNLEIVGSVKVSGVSTFSQVVKLESSLTDFYGNVGTAGSVLISTGAGVSWVPSFAAGLQGTQGITGSQGTQGTQGITGSQGTQGTQGITGSQGTQGTQGITGSQGTQGTQGITGSQGTQGIQGSNDGGVTVVNDESTNALRYITFEDVTSGTSSNIGVSSTKLTFNPLTGNVGVGTTNPSSKLQVEGNAYYAGIVTSVGGFISVASTSAVQISIIGDQLIFNAVGIGSTSLTLFPSP